MVTDKEQCNRRPFPSGLLLILVLAVWGWAGLGWAGQQPAAGSKDQKAHPAVKATKAKSPANPAPKPGAASAAKAAVPAKKVVKPAAPAQRAARRTQAPKPKETKAKEPVPTPSSQKETAELTGGSRRDPFKLPVYAPPTPGQAGEGELVTGPLPPGKRGLLISQLRLEGIVRLDTSSQMIAVVTNFTKRAYFVRENDAVYNGVVSKITPDSVSFRENYLDPNGRVATREVVRRLGPAPGEGR